MSVRIVAPRRDGTTGRVSKKRREQALAELAEQWPRIGYALTVTETGYVQCDYFVVKGRMDFRGMVGEERAQTCEELARFYEWSLAQRADETARDVSLRYLLGTWTDSMCYCLRRSATTARGEDPGPWIDQWERRPDLVSHRRLTLVTELPRRRPHRPNLTLVRTEVAQ